ncbi:MAG: Ig-like domain repeat protein, partial [Chloroflexi bacterium]|nr:Ig-like domain repeat protein [Chloroflexota bacterium]
ALLSHSPAIDAIPTSSGGCPATDQRGDPRPEDAAETACDIGAYESSFRPTGTTLSSSANPSTFGQAVTFRASVSGSGSGTPTGTVTFKDGSTSLDTAALGAGANPANVATLTTNGLSAGPHSITAVYNGDSTFEASTSAALSQTVNKASTTTSLASSQNPSTVNQQVTYTAKVSVTTPGAGTPTGTVAFADAGSTISGCASVTLDSSGRATCPVAYSGTGSHPITATYSGNTNFLGSADSLTQVVKQATTISLTSSVSPSLLNQAVTFTAAVAPSGAGTPTGTVQFAVDGANQGSTVTLNGSGQASLSISTLAVGSHTITATYGGDGTFLGGTSKGLTQQVTFKVCPLYNPSTPLLHGSTVMIRLTLCDVNSVNVSSQTTVLTVTGVSPAPGVPGPTGTFSFVPTLGRSVTGSAGGYQYYLNTSGYGPGSYTLLFTASGDPVAHQAAFTLS